MELPQASASPASPASPDDLQGVQTPSLQTLSFDSPFKIRFSFSQELIYVKLRHALLYLLQYSNAIAL
jgi:hypothetical protein